MATKNGSHPEGGVDQFDGLVTFYLRPQSLGTDLRSMEIERDLLAALKLNKATDQDQLDETERVIRSRIAEYAIILSVTDDIQFHFDGRERRPLRDFKAWWQGVNKRVNFALKETWQGYTLIGADVVRAWWAAYREAQVPYRVDEAQLPEVMLDAQQKEELEDPQSPLANAAQD